MVQAGVAVPVHEETDVRPDAILFVHNAVAHSRVAGLEKFLQLRERLADDNMFVKNADKSLSSHSAAATVSNSQRRI